MKETWKCTLYEQLPFINRLKMYALFINGKMRQSFIDSDLLYRGTLYNMLDCISFLATMLYYIQKICPLFWRKCHPVKHIQWTKNASKWENENIYKNFLPDTKNDDKTDMAAIIISDQISFTERNAILSIIGEKFCLY